ncbi:adenylate cyclase [Novosphingobium sp.]|uniref:adenylate cyclase n=1 Tax=Novosphingobium sp. TaxID=1874826 RepID=UPI00286DB126|nr:adenylate cyclase [Novosphingobium sp.]
MDSAAVPAMDKVGDAAWFRRFTTILAVFIVACFALNAVLGRAAYSYTLFWPHAHALVMISWLALHVFQARHAAGGDLARHRRLGWIGAYLAVIVVGSMSFSGVAALRGGYVPPFYSPAYFLALTQVGAVVFGGLVFAAITRRSQTDFHRRLITGSLIAIASPALGRVLPMPLIAPWGGWLILAIQLGLVGVMALHDRRTMGRIHPSTATVGGILAMTEVLVSLAATNRMVQELAASIAGG